MPTPRLSLCALFGLTFGAGTGLGLARFAGPRLLGATTTSFRCGSSSRTAALIGNAVEFLKR
jgi:hypothetical protein